MLYNRNKVVYKKPYSMIVIVSMLSVVVVIVGLIVKVANKLDFDLYMLVDIVFLLLVSLSYFVVFFTLCVKYASKYKRLLGLSLMYMGYSNILLGMLVPAICSNTVINGQTQYLHPNFFAYYFVYICIVVLNTIAQVLYFVWSKKARRLK